MEVVQMGKFSLNDMLNSQSKPDTARAASKDFEIVQIPIDKIIPSGSNIYSIQNIEELAASIETMGLLHNLVVKEQDKDTGLYEIVSGERRYQACKLLYNDGNTLYATVPCKIEYGADKLYDELMLIYANATARELSDYEKTFQAGRIKDILQEMKDNGYKFKGRLREIAAQMLDVSTAQMGRMESISKNLSTDLMEEFKKENIGITAAYDLSTLDADKQKAAAAELATTGSIDLDKHKEKPVKQNPRAKLRAELENKDCEYGGKCTNAENISNFLNSKGNLELCAGCCAVCRDKPYCGTVCDKIQHTITPANEPKPEEPRKPAKTVSHEAPEEPAPLIKTDIQKALEQFEICLKQGCGLLNSDNQNFINTVIEALREKEEGYRTQKAAIPQKAAEPTKIGNVTFGAGVTIWNCPTCGTFITRTHKYCWKCGQALSYVSPGQEEVK
jgi:ParB family chromosome partitioning protein